MVDANSTTISIPQLLIDLIMDERNIYIFEQSTYAREEVERWLEEKQSEDNLREKATSGLAKLGRREREVFQFIAKGMQSPEIARIMGISIRTVETHRYNIRKKLNINSSYEFVCVSIYGSS